MTVQLPKTKMLVFLCSVLIAVALFVSCNNAGESNKAAEPATSTEAATKAKDTADTKPVGDPPRDSAATK